MSRFFNKDAPFFDNTTGGVLSFGVVYFGLPNTDPMDQDGNAKVPYTDRDLITPADSVQTLNIGGKLEQRLYLDGAYSITVTDADGNVINTDPYVADPDSDAIANVSSVDGVSVSDALADLQAQIIAISEAALNYTSIWPVGCIYITTLPENPGSRLGFGTWVAHAEGQVIMGVGSYTDSNGETQSVSSGGLKGTWSTALTESQMPRHRHHLFGGVGNPSVSGIDPNDTVAAHWDSGYNGTYVLSPAPGDPVDGVSAYTGGPTATSSASDGAPHSNIQPSIGVYIWRRTA